MTFSVEIADAVAQTAVDFMCAWNITADEASRKAQALYRNVMDRVETEDVRAIYQNDAAVQEKSDDEVVMTIMRMAAALMISRKTAVRPAIDLAVNAISSAVKTVRDRSPVEA